MAREATLKVEIADLDVVQAAIAKAARLGRAAGYGEAVATLRDGTAYEDWCATNGRHTGTRGTLADYLTDMFDATEADGG
jgi:hypothetical protein